MTTSAKNSAAPGAFDQVKDMPGHLLRRCQQIAVSIFLKECRAFDLTPLQFAVLAALDQSGPLDQARLGGFVALDRTTVSVVVKKLEKRGLARREVSARDRRSKLVYITERGRALTAEALPAVVRAQEKLLAPLAAQERRLLLSALTKLAEHNNEESRAPLRVL